ncbi:MAG: MarR family transcriptional regulator [Epulopiscium sp.]|jgi:DNA-binding MarR family transcriptional regulator|nr:MarR family transcriptional regulator [Candidatus Epulonipiscium sp.]
MTKLVNVLNHLMVDIFNDILTIEETSLKKGMFSDLSVKEMHTIEAIGMYHPRTMSEVAQDLKITVGTLTTAINRLVKKGYVERNRIEDDRRIVQIQLTKKGKLAYRIHEKFHTDMIKAMLDGLETEEEDILVKSLSQLSKYLKDKYKLNK